MSSHIAFADAVRIERIESLAWLDQHAAAPAAAITALGLRTRAIGHAALLAADRSDSLLNNRAIGVGMLEAATPELLDAVEAHYAPSPQGFAINLCPLAEPNDVSRELARRGFQTWFHHVKWVRGVSTPPPLAHELHVSHVTAADAERFAEVQHDDDTPERAAQMEWTVACVGRPGWTHLLAWDGDEPVAGAAVFVHHDTAWLGHARTRDSSRRRGAQQTLLAERIRVAGAAGATLLTTETAPDWPDLPRESLRNVARAGFRITYERPSWIRFPG